MNKRDSVQSPKVIEEYIYKKLKETYWKFPGEIAPSTTFRELERHDDPELIAPDLLMEIEEDLDVYLTDEVVLALDNKDANASMLIDAVIKHYAPDKL